MSIFTLMSVFSASFAWFEMIKNVSNESNNMPVRNLDDSVSQIEFHEFVEEKALNNETYYTFDTEASSTLTISENEVTQTGSLEMDLYEMDDPHHPILLLMKLNVGNLSIKFRLTDENAYYIADGEEGHGLDETSNPLSSVAEFYSFTFSKTTSDPTSLTSRTLNIDSTDYYALKTSEFVRGTNSSSFVTLDESGDYDGFSLEAELFNGNSHDYAYLGVVIDYYSESLQYIYSLFMGDPILNEDLLFSCDWEMII